MLANLCLGNTTRKGGFQVLGQNVVPSINLPSETTMNSQENIDFIVSEVKNNTENNVVLSMNQPLETTVNFQENTDLILGEAKNNIENNLLPSMNLPLETIMNFQEHIDFIVGEVECDISTNVVPSMNLLIEAMTPLDHTDFIIREVENNIDNNVALHDTDLISGEFDNDSLLEQNVVPSINLPLENIINPIAHTGLIVGEFENNIMPEFKEDQAKSIPDVSIFS